MGKRILVAWAFMVAITVLPRAAAAQVSVWLQKDVSGVGGDAGLSFYDDDSVEFLTRVGYSYKGFLEADLGITVRGFPDDNEIADDLYALGFSPSLQYHPLKQSSGMPVSLGLTARYESQSLQSEVLKEAEIEATGYAVGGSAAIYRFIRIAPRFGVTPSAGVQVSYSKIKVASPDDEVTDDDTNFSAMFVGNFAYMDRGGHIWAVAPSLVVGETIAFGFSISFIMPFGRSGDDADGDDPATTAPPVALYR